MHNKRFFSVFVIDRRRAVSTFASPLKITILTNLSIGSNSSNNSPENFLPRKFTIFLKKSKFDKFSRMVLHVFLIGGGWI